MIRFGALVLKTQPNSFYHFLIIYGSTVVVRR